MRYHRKIWIWWGPWWAAQFYWAKCLSLGVHVDFASPYVDLHFLWFTVSVGNNPVITNERDRQRGSCRGFFFADSPLL
jgi:hypothetical protein